MIFLMALVCKGKKNTYRRRPSKQNCISKFLYVKKEHSLLPENSTWLYFVKTAVKSLLFHLMPDGMQSVYYRSLEKGREMRSGCLKSIRFQWVLPNGKCQSWDGTERHWLAVVVVSWLQMNTMSNTAAALLERKSSWGRTYIKASFTHND